MGDMADMMMEGILCAECGVFIDDEVEIFGAPAGYPRYCEDCGGLPDINGQKPMRTQARKNVKPKRRRRR